MAQAAPDLINLLSLRVHHHAGLFCPLLPQSFNVLKCKLNFRYMGRKPVCTYGVPTLGFQASVGAPGTGKETMWNINGKLSH